MIEAWFSECSERDLHKQNKQRSNSSCNSIGVVAAVFFVITIVAE